MPWLLVSYTARSSQFSDPEEQDVPGARSETILSPTDCRGETGSRFLPFSGGNCSISSIIKNMVALIHNHSPVLKVWRVLGVILMVTQSGCDVKDNRIKKRRLRARRECVRVAAMMKKMSLPEASAAPAVVTPSTPSAAPSAAKGVFARAVTVDEQSD